MSQQQPPNPQQPQMPGHQLLTLPGFNEPDDIATTGAQPPWWRRRRNLVIAAIILLVIIVGGTILTVLARQGQGPGYRTQRPTAGDLAITISATGPLQSAVYNLSFPSNATGTNIIRELHVDVGDKVKKDQILAKLDETALKDAADQQQITVNNAREALASAQNNLVAAVALANANAAAAKTSLNNSQQSVNQQKTVSDATVEVAQQTLESDQQALNEIRQVQQANITAAETELKNAEANLETVRDTAKAQKAQAGQMQKQEESACAVTPTPVPSTSDCKKLAQDKHDATVALADESVKTAENRVNAARASLQQAKAVANQTISSAEAKIEADQQALTQAKAQTSQSNTTAQSTASNNQQNVNTTSASSNQTIATAQSAVVTTQSNLRIAEAQLAQAKHNLQNAILKAPHEGTVTIVNGSVGSAPGSGSGTSSSTSASSSTSVANTFIQIVDTSVLQVVANVNETDTAYLKSGQAAQFTVNSYGARSFKGSVSAISPNGQTTQNVVTYPVYVDVNKQSIQGANLYPGMTANITVTVLQHTGVQTVTVEAVNFARLASSGGTTNNTPQLITRQDANAAMVRANQMLTALQQGRDLSADNPIPAFVIVSTANDQFSAKPVVLGLTDGAVYEVLDGVTPEHNIVVGTSASGQATPGVTPAAGA
jgi:multidrug efflux pump subunit AcrA (membrane-fusion protein)